MPTVTFVIGVGFEGPIAAQQYSLRDVKIQVSYPPAVTLGLPTPINLPPGASTVFEVTWKDPKNKTSSQLLSKGAERHFPIHKALSDVSEMLVAFKLNRIGHSDGLSIRTIGIADTLFYYSLVDGIPTGDLNLGIKLKSSAYPWFQQGDDVDPHGTTTIAVPHIGESDHQVARRYVRCFELLEHGYFNETIIVAHSILDDIVQIVLNNLLHQRGLEDEASRKQLLRGIKESRHEIYLGPLLKITAGITIDDVWKNASLGVAWLNSVRNKVAHSGGLGKRDDACKAIFVSLQTVAGLDVRGLIDAKMPSTMLRHTRLLASWTSAPPKWVPLNDEIESNPFS